MSYKAEPYWDKRYRDGRDSGAGSRGNTGTFKANYLTDLMATLPEVKTVADWGCGDGQVLEKVDFGDHLVSYTGVDVSNTILNRMRAKFTDSRYRFVRPEDYSGTADLNISMDVLFHFPENARYYEYLECVFNGAPYVVVYSTDYDGGQTANHVRRRKFTNDVTDRFPGYGLVESAFEHENPLPTDAGVYLYSLEV